MTDEPRPTLADRKGALFVTLAAAKAYLDAVEVPGGIETARRELTELLLDARQSPSDPDAYRARSRRSGLDINARVVPEGRLLVVVSIGVRGVGPPHRGGGRVARRAAERGES